MDWFKEFESIDCDLFKFSYEQRKEFIDRISENLKNREKDYYIDLR